MQRRERLRKVLGLVAVFFLTTAGMPDNGMPDNGMPDNGMPDNGMPDNGMPDNGNSPDALINSPLFFNRGTHAFWVGHPFTAATIDAPGNPLKSAISDKFSAMVMGYQWQLCHPQGDNATVTDSLGKKHTFQGRVGICVLASGHGWHKDAPLDQPTARWMSSATITQVNRHQIHNRYSLRGPRTDQLTAMAPSMTSYLYKFGSYNPVEALSACPAAPPTTGKARCGWKPHFVGVGKPGSKVHIAAKSKGVKMLLQINLGIHAANPGEPGAIASSGAAGKVDPSLDFTVPVGGTFNVQWAADPRPTGRTLPAKIAPPTLTAAVTQGGGTLLFPADEAFVFTNREMYATAMLYNLTAADHNITPIPGVLDGGKQVASCEPRTNSDGNLQYCAAETTTFKQAPTEKAPSGQATIGSCVPCKRSFKRGAKTVIFPNAHMWLSSSWTNAQDYYALRSCSSDLSTCVAKFEGFIDASYCGPSNPRCTGNGAAVVAKACQVQSQDHDTANPRPYPGTARALNDAFQCHIGSGADGGFGVTTFFANYGSTGSCWATKAKDPACSYRPKDCHRGDKRQSQGKALAKGRDKDKDRDDEGCEHDEGGEHGRKR